MKRAIAVLLLIGVSSLCFAGSRGGGGKKESGVMSVQVRQTPVKASANYLGTSVGTLSYGQKVNVVGDAGNWFRIEHPSGWVPKSALTKHSVAMDGDQKGAAAAGKRDEVALAGKGFNPQVEAQYKKNNAGLTAAYAGVDRVESYGASVGQLKSFQNAGRLLPR